MTKYFQGAAAFAATTATSLTALAQDEAAPTETAQFGGFDPSTLLESLQENGVDIGLKLLGGIVLWIVGRWLISFALGLAQKAMTKNNLDRTAAEYIVAALKVLLTIALVVAILGFFGVETTTFAALLAAAGVAIGMAWSGLLANFAAGIFIVILRPFNNGDFVTVGGITGTVKEIGLFVTTVDTMDNVATIVGNNKIFSEIISNFSLNDVRRVDLVAQLNHTVDPNEAIAKLKTALAKLPHASKEVGPDIHILEFNLAGPVLCVRPYVHTDHYWDVYFATNMAIKETFGDAGYPVPEKHFYHRQKAV